MGRTIFSTLFVAAWPALVFLLAGDWWWAQAWFFAVWLLGLYLVTTLWMHTKDPALLAERRRRPSKGDGPTEASASDRELVMLIFLGFAVWIVVMPLDAKRYGWTPPLPRTVGTVGLASLLVSAVFLFRAVYDNTFLSGVVRVQTDRKQHVVSSGVYSLVRHPMYLGMTLMFFGAPLLLGSLVALPVAVAITIVLMVRIIREERVLVRELDGYEAYRQSVRYRLLPLLW